MQLQRETKLRDLRKVQSHQITNSHRYPWKIPTITVSPSLPKYPKQQMWNTHEVNTKDFPRKTKWLICWCSCSLLGKPVVWAEFLTLCQGFKISHLSAKRRWNAAKTTYGKWITAPYNLLPWLWSFIKPARRADQLFCGKSLSPRRGPKAALAELWGEGWQRGGQLALILWASLAHFCLHVLGLRSPHILWKQQRLCSEVLVPLYKFHPFIIYNVCLSGVYYL